MKPIRRRPISIRPLREALGIPRAALARESGISTTTIRYAEAGVISSRTALAIAPVLGVPPEELLPWGQGLEP